MSLSPELETKGLTAYEQARAFERLRTWRLPLGYLAGVLIPALYGARTWEGRRSEAEFYFLVTALFALVSWFHWARLRVAYAANLKLLAELDAAYGDQLPWRQVEKHLAELEQLKRDLAEEQGEPK